MKKTLANILCDISQTGNRYFRDAFLSYVHYKYNGEIGIIRVDGTGVGQYQSSDNKHEAEDHLKAEGFEKREISDGFLVKSTANKSYLYYPNIKGLKAYKQVNLKTFSGSDGEFLIELRMDDLKGKVIGKKVVKLSASEIGSRDVEIEFSDKIESENLIISVEQNNGKVFQLESFSFSKYSR